MIIRRGLSRFSRARVVLTMRGCLYNAESRNITMKRGGLPALPEANPGRWHKWSSCFTYLLTHELTHSIVPAQLRPAQPRDTRPARRVGRATEGEPMDIWEDTINEEAITAYEDAVNPPELSDCTPFMGLTTNLLGVNYGAEAEADDAREDENARSYKVGETIGGQILEQDEGMRHSHRSALGYI